MPRAGENYLKKRVYIETDQYTVNLVELLIEEVRRLNDKIDRLESKIASSSQLNETPLLTLNEAKTFLNISAKTLYNIRREGKIPTKRINGQVMLLKKDVEKYMNG